MRKNYKEQTYNDTIKCLKNNIASDANCVFTFDKMMTDISVKFPEVKDAFTHDMNAFLTKWFDLLRDCNNCTLKLRSKIITFDFIDPWNYFNKTAFLCFHTLRYDKNPYTGNTYGDDVKSYLSCIFKALVQTKRRSLGLDNNSKKFNK